MNEYIDPDRQERNRRTRENFERETGGRYREPITRPAAVPFRTRLLFISVLGVIACVLWRLVP